MSPDIEADFWREVAEIEAESIGWQPLEPGVYLHITDDQATEVLVTGIAQADAGLNDGNIFRQVIPLSRMHRALNQSQYPSPDWRKILPVGCAGRGGNVPTCWSFVQNSV